MAKTKGGLFRVIAAALNRRHAVESMPDGHATTLQMVLIERGVIQRGLGQVRSSPAGISSASAVLAAGVFQRRDGARLLVWGNSAGTVAAEVDPLPESL